MEIHLQFDLKNISYMTHLLLKEIDFVIEWEMMD